MKEPRLQRWKNILAMAWPLIIANSFWNLQLTIDRVFLADYSTEALGAAMAVMGVFWVPMALLQQTASYITTFVAQYHGAGQPHRIGSYLWQALHVSWIGGMAFFSLMLITDDFFAFVAHAPKVQELEISYFNALTYSALPTAIMAAVSGFFTGLGQTRTVIWINFAGFALNAVLDYLLIAGRWGFPELGIAGAGYATALANYGASIFAALLLFTSTNIRSFQLLKNWHPKITELKQFLKYGIPSGLQWALEGLAFTVFLIVLGRIKDGEAALASSSIAVTVMMLSVLPSMGVAQAVLALVGQRLGEKRADLAEQSTWDGVHITAVYIGFVALTFFAFPEFYLSWFRNQDNEALWTQVSALAPTLLKIVRIFTIFDSIYLNISFALKGAGDTRFVSWIALTVPWPLMVLPAYLIKDFENAATLAWCFTVLYTLTLTSILTHRFREGRWKKMTVMTP